MGRRSRTARFLPNILVFPGGGLERADHRPSGFSESIPIAPGGIDAATRRAFPALLRCALRETWEETGVLVGRRRKAREAPAGEAIWQAYADAGIAPAFESLRLLARAITPPQSPIRFHTRFFCAEVTEAVFGEPRDDELEQVRWLPVEEALAEDLIDVTAFMLQRALVPGPSDPAPLFRYRQDKAVVV